MEYPRLATNIAAHGLITCSITVLARSLAQVFPNEAHGSINVEIDSMPIDADRGLTAPVQFFVRPDGTATTIDITVR